MAAPSLPDPPAQLKAVQSYMKTAQDVDRVDPIVSYWVRLFSTESALKIDRDTPECKTFLSALILWLEQFKSTHKDNEAVSNQTVGQAHYENFAMTLFNKADTLDRDGTANIKTVKMFFTAAVLFEAMAVFGPLTDEIAQRAKYAKFKAAYIQKCLKTGLTPKPGPIDGSDLDGTSNDAPRDPTTSTDQSLKSSDIPGTPSSTSGLNPAQQKSQDPFIIKPSIPPSSFKPSLPPSLPSNSNYPTNDPSSSKSSDPTRDNSFSGESKDQQKSTINATKFFATDGSSLKPEDIIQGQKYCKFANSALQYDDIPTAVANLEKALKLLTTGQRQD